MALYLPLILFFTLHFALIQTLVRREKLWLAVGCILISISYSYLQYHKEGNVWNRQNVLSLLPASYLVVAIFLRYVIFNRYFSFLFKHKRAPYDPIMIYPGVFTVYWDVKNYNPSPIEYFYSFSILVFPWWIFYLL